MDVLDASFTGSHVSAVGPKLAHASQCQFPQIALLHPACDQRHGDVSLDPVDAHLRERPPAVSATRGAENRHSLLMLDKGILMAPGLRGSAALIV